MAFKTVMTNQGNFIKSGDLAEGESIEGYLLGTQESEYGFMIKLLNSNNQVLTVIPHGNLTKLEEEVEEGTINPYLLTRITRTGSYESKKQMDPKTLKPRNVPTFTVEQDQDQSVNEADAKSALEKDEADYQEAKSSTNKFSSKRR